MPHPISGRVICITAAVVLLSAVLRRAGAEWHDAAQRECRRLLVERVIQYRAGDPGSLPAPVDGDRARTGKPVISVTHVAGKQIFATHSVEGGLGLTRVLHDTTNGTACKAYVNRSQVDMLRGFFGGPSDPFENERSGVH